MGTLDDILDLIKKLPPYPTLKWLEEWQEFVIEKAIGRTAAGEFLTAKIMGTFLIPKLSEKNTAI